MRRRTFATQVIWIGISARAMCASAQAPPAALHVERAAGAESCPDAAELDARIEAIRRQPNAAATTYSVAFAREGNTYSAQLRAQNSCQRNLESRADDCEALAQATAVTLALLYDASPEAPAPALVPALSASSSSSPPPSAAVTPESRATPTQLGLALGAGIAAGVLRPWAPALLGELALRSEPVRFGLGVAWIPEQHIEQGAGASHLALIAADARACYALVRRPWLRLEGCTGLMLGSLAAAASGYTKAAPQSHQLFAALPLELTLGQSLAHASWELSATLLIPYRRSQFQIDGLGTIYDTPPLSALLSLRASGWFTL